MFDTNAAEHQANIILDFSLFLGTSIITVWNLTQIFLYAKKHFIEHMAHEWQKNKGERIWDIALLVFLWLIIQCWLLRNERGMCSGRGKQR